MDNKLIFIPGRLMKFIKPVFIALIIGILADKITFQNFAMGFFAIVPATVIVLLSLFKLLNIRSKALIVIATTFSFLLAVMFGVWFFEFRVGYISDMYGLVYIFGFLPSIIIGLLFGFYFAKQINKP